MFDTLVGAELAMQLPLAFSLPPRCGPCAAAGEKWGSTALMQRQPGGPAIRAIRGRGGRVSPCDRC